VCLLRPESDLLTSAVVRSTVDYIMAANNEEIKLFDIDKKTGEYLGEYVSSKKSDLAYGKVKERKFVYASKGLFGGINIAILFVAEKFIHDFMVPKKVAGFDQKEARIALYNFIKENYNTYYNQLERNYKYSM